MGPEDGDPQTARGLKWSLKWMLAASTFQTLAYSVQAFSNEILENGLEDENHHVENCIKLAHTFHLQPQKLL